MSCAAHGLAAGPDGRCVLCRREERDRQGGRTRALGALLVLTATLVCAVALAARLFRREAPDTPVAAALAAEPVSTVESTDTVPTTAPRPPTPQVAIAPAPPSTELRIAAPSSPVASTRASASAAQSPMPPSGAQVQAALASVPIVMFSTSWCPTCARARSFLQANGIRYTERDIDHDEAALEELKRRSGNTLIPTLDIDGTMLRSGFDSNAIASTLAASVEKRLGVKGISVRPVGR